MILIKHVVHDPDLPGDVDHKVNRPYVKRKGAGAVAPTAPAADQDTFMRDARTNASAHTQTAVARLFLGRSSNLHGFRGTFFA
jgi:hypothetical protein